MAQEELAELAGNIRTHITKLKKRRGLVTHDKVKNEPQQMEAPGARANGGFSKVTRERRGRGLGLVAGG